MILTSKRVFAISLAIATTLKVLQVHAEETYPWEINAMDAALKTVQKPAASSNCETKQVISPQCGDRTDDVCKALWSEKNKGHLKLSDGEILAGKSAKSDTSIAWLESAKAIVNSFPRLPSDIQAKAKPILADLQKLLNNEKKTQEWDRLISRVLDRWNQAVEDTANARLDRKFPGLRKIDEENITLEQRVQKKTVYLALEDELLKARYAESPNWKRVEKTFGQVQKDLLAEIRELKLPDTEKEKMLKTVSEVRLTLPYSDPNKITQSEGCNSTLVNAFFSPQHKKFTVCAGLFNTYQSEASLYAVIAHELGHSVDPTAMASMALIESGPLEKMFNRVGGTGLKKMTCEEWQAVTNFVAKPEAPPESRNNGVLQKLYDCLAPKTGLGAITDSAKKQKAQSSTKNLLSAYASTNDFLTLAQPTVTKDGKVKENEFYMRPDKLRTLQNGGSSSTQETRRADASDVFVQALECETMQLDGKKLKYAELPKDKRVQLFNVALARTDDIMTARKKEWLDYCGVNCAELTNEHLSAESGENFADWIAIKTLGRFLERQPDLRKRRESAGSAFALFCDGQSAKSDAPDLAAAEKKYSLEEHPDSRIRRLSVFNKRNAELVKCKVNPEQQGYGACEL